MKKYLNEEEVTSINPELHTKIEEYINEHIVNWGESCETEAEGEALESFGDNLRIWPTYRVYPDGSITVEMNPEQSTEEANRSFLTFEWEENEEDYYDEDEDEDDEDEDREPETSHGFFLDYLRGNVTLKFNDEDETGDDSFGWDEEIEEEVIALFK